MRRILYITFFVATATLAHAQPLTLERCREMAIESNRTLRSSGERVAASRDLLAAYKTNRLPSLLANANYLYSTAKYSESITGGFLPTFSADATTGVMIPIENQYAYMPDINFDVEVGSVFNVGAMLTQPIYLGGKVATSIKMAQLGVGVAESDRRRSEAEIVVECDEAFYTLIKVEEMVNTAARYEAVVEAFHRQMLSAVKSGMAHRNDLLKVEVRLNEARMLSHKAKNGLRLAKMNICYVVGLPLSTTDIVVSDQFDVGAVIESRELDVTRRPEYSMLESQVAIKELEVDLSKSDFMPSLSAIASYGYFNGATINDYPLLNSANFSAGVMLSVPIFHWGEGRRKRSASRREVSIAENQFEQLTQQMQLELMQTINNYDDASMEVRIAELSVVQAEENMRVSESQYRAGMETLADCLEAQALWQQSMGDLVEARAAQRVSYTKYLKASGAQ